ncbi:response regulator receiver protein [Oceanidesulfovibrio indonesiensis]|uniref:Response regulator receiver protein n=1 Tax=Oceanidesulfovibrio indonesiensis TaxID=54767 RepID=A0A7M3ME05_9BACT|nr:HD domain-containing phosphohydrolase [Oceanidesulfovibrio indonesiensis]TVM16942.1 response regulator receiver protein [Oceanidesulfovibrio indonesiensis]
MQSQRILLVDDEPVLLEVCREGLIEKGYAVQTANNGAEALDILEREPFELVISDIRMPRLGGLDLIKEIKHRRLDTSVIVLTGYGTIENAVECLQQGASEYLLKPFDFSRLISKIEKVFEERRLKRYDSEVGGLLHILSLERELSMELDEPGLLKKFLHHVKKTFKPTAMAYFTPRNGGMDPFFTLGSFFKEPGTLRWFEQMAGSVANSAQPRLVDPANGVGSNVTKQLGLVGVSAMAAPLNAFYEKDGVLVVVRDARSENPRTSAFGLSDLQLFTIFAAHAGSAAGYHRSCRRIQRMNVEFITSYVQAVEAKDTYTKGHSERVRDISLQLGQALGLGQAQLDDLGAAALLHDIGKIGIPDEILNKPNALNFHEQKIMRRHPVIARDILAGVKSLHPILPVVYHHHERYDGLGYPDGLSGEAIPYLARILQVADGFEAMTSNRAYQQARDAHEALDILQAGAGKQWDPAIVNAWAQAIENDKSSHVTSKSAAAG